MATKDFVEYTPNIGNKNASINVTASKNTSSARSTVLNISAKGITKTVNINQKKNDKEFIVVGNSGNIVKIQLE